MGGESETRNDLDKIPGPGLCFNPPPPNATLPTTGFAYHPQNKVYGTSPSIFHFNGGNMAHYVDVESQMWYKKKGKKRGRGMDGKDLGEVTLQVGDRDGKHVKYKDLCPNPR